MILRSQHSSGSSSATRLTKRSSKQVTCPNLTADIQVVDLIFHDIEELYVGRL